MALLLLLLNAPALLVLWIALCLLLACILKGTER